MKHDDEFILKIDWEVLRMENNKPKSKIKIKQSEVIENNIKLIEILFYIFKGQILDMDLKEFCLKFKIYQTENQYNIVIKKLITNKILKIKKLVNTNNNVLVAAAPVYNYFNLGGKTTKYSVETVTRNSYLTYILCTRLKVDINKDIKEIVRLLETKTTLLSTKRDVESCYKMFKLTEQGKVAKKEALYREEKRKIKLKNIEKVELKEVELIYSETLQTLRERDIYFIKDTIIITDNNSNYILSNLATKIGAALRILVEQVEVGRLEEIGIVVLVKDKASKIRLENTFITKYKGGQKVKIDEAINKAIKEGGYNLRANYQYKNTTEKGVYELENIYKSYSEMFDKLRIKIENTNIAYKHNSDLKVKGLIEHKKKQKEQSQRAKILQELKEEGLLKEDIIEKIEVI